MFAIKNLVPAHCPVTFSPSPVLPTSPWRRIYFCTCICVVSNLVLPLAAYLGFLLFFKVIFKVTSCQELWSTLLIVVIYKFLLRCTDDLCSLFSVSYFVQVVTELPFFGIRGESRGGVITHRKQSWFAPYGQQSGKTAFAGWKAFAVLSGSLRRDCWALDMIWTLNATEKLRFCGLHGCRHEWCVWDLTRLGQWNQQNLAEKALLPMETVKLVKWCFLSPFLLLNVREMPRVPTLFTTTEWQMREWQFWFREGAQVRQQWAALTHAWHGPQPLLCLLLLRNSNSLVWHSSCGCSWLTYRLLSET